MLADALPFLIVWTVFFLGGCVLVAHRDRQDRENDRTTAESDTARRTPTERSTTP